MAPALQNNALVPETLLKGRPLTAVLAPLSLAQLTLWFDYRPLLVVIDCEEFKNLRVLINEAGCVVDLVVDDHIQVLLTRVFGNFRVGEFFRHDDSCAVTLTRAFNDSVFRYGG